MNEKTRTKKKKPMERKRNLLFLLLLPFEFSVGALPTGAAIRMICQEDTIPTPGTGLFGALDHAVLDIVILM
jgi:hypothetical protein